MAMNMMDTRAAIATVSDMTARNSTPCWPIVSWRAGVDRRIEIPRTPSRGMPGTQFFDPRLFFIAGQAREEREHRCQAGFAGLQYGLDPFEDPLLTGGQAHRLPRSACPGAGHPPAATPAASTRAPAQLDDDMAVVFPGLQIHADHKGAFLLQQQGRVLTQRLVRQLPTLRRTPAVCPIRRRLRRK